MPSDLLPCLLVHLEEKRKKSCVILSGGIGAGKTRTGERLAAALTARGFTVGGILSPRVVRCGKTIGYTVRDLASGVEQPFASLNPPGVTVGKYFISEQGLAFARSAIARASRIAQAVFVDEVGRLELSGRGYAPALRALLHSRALPILLIRSSFVDAVVKTFSITHHEILSVEPDAPVSHPA